MRDRPALTCPECGQPWWVSRVQRGQIAVRPGSWWQPYREVWEATCGCEEFDGSDLRVIQRSSEGELYRALGYLYA